MTEGKKFKSRFIQGGLAGYPQQYGTVLIKKESLDKFVNTLEGKPVIINHQEVNANNVNDIEVGRVHNVWFDSDGWYWCDGVITNQKALDLIEKGWSVSCSYNVSNYSDRGGTENNIKYDMEFLDGNFTHLAIVKNPRYEGADIVVVNSNLEADNDKWITIHPNGEDSKGRPLLLKDGESPKEAIERAYGDKEKQLHLLDKEGTIQKSMAETKDKAKSDLKDLRKLKETYLKWFSDVDDDEIDKKFDDILKKTKNLIDIDYGDFTDDEKEGNLAKIAKKEKELEDLLQANKGDGKATKDKKEDTKKADNSLTNTLAEAMTEIILENCVE